MVPVDPNLEPDRPPRSGDRSALASMLARLQPLLRAYVERHLGTRLRAKESVDDIAQSVCREVLADMGELAFDSEEAFRAFLFRTADRKLADRARHHARIKRDARREVAIPDSSAAMTPVEIAAYAGLETPSRNAQALELADRALAALKTMSAKERELFALARVRKTSMAEIAERFGTSEAHARTLVSRTMAKLARRLEL